MRGNKRKQRFQALQQLVKAISPIEDSYLQLEIFRAILPHLPAELLPEALEVSLAIQNKWSRASALEAIAPYLPAELLPEAFEAALAIHYEPRRASVLRVITLYLPAEFLPEALELARTIHDNWWQASVLSTIATRFSGVWPEALQAVLAIQDERDRARSLREITPYLRTELLPEALKIARTIRNKEWRDSALRSIAPYLPEVWSEALEVARTIRNKEGRADSLYEIATHLPEVWPEALEAVRAMDNEGRRVFLFREIARHLPEVWPEVLEAVRAMDVDDPHDELYRASALSDIATHLPEIWPEIWPEVLRVVLQAVRKIRDDYFQAYDLTEIAPYLPAELLLEALQLVQEELTSVKARQPNFLLFLRKIEAYSSVLPPLLLISLFQLWVDLLSATIHGRPQEEPPPPLPLIAIPEEVERIPATVEPTPRYADLTFYSDDKSRLCEKLPLGHVLQAEHWYQLEVAVREKPEGIPPVERKRRPIREPKQRSPVTIMVTAEGNGFAIEEPVRILLLPPHGNSTENAYFRVRPLHQSATVNDLAAIRIRTYYQFNLLEVNVIKAEVVGKFDSPNQSRLGLENPITFTQERLEREYLDFDYIEPRAMHVDISKEEEHFLCNFTFFNETKQKVELAAPIHLRATDLEDALLNIRQIWYDIAISKTFTQQLEGDTDEFLDYIRKLAKAGRNLWTKLFKVEQGSSMFQIGKWLEKHPLKPGAIIQISLAENATDFLFPWSLLYDQKVPRKNYELPDLQGFWGLRYCIEQQLPNQLKGTDTPIQTNGKMKLAFMLWEQFRNAEQEKDLMERLMTESVNKLEVTIPPITDADVCYDLLYEGNAHILYFYTHGYTRHRQADIGVGQLFNLFLERYERLANHDPVRENLKFLYDSIKQGAVEPNRSWIELTYGKLYLDELYDEIEDKFRWCLEFFVTLTS